MMRRIAVMLVCLGALFIAREATASVRIGGATTTSLSNGLVGYWPLDGSTTSWTTNTTSDLSGNGSTGTLVSMSTSTSPTTGKIGLAINFNGSTSYIEADGAASKRQTGDVSMSAWIYLPTTYTSSSAGEVVVDLGDNPSTNDVVLSLGPQGAAADGKLHFDLWQVGNSFLRTSSAKKRPWHPVGIL